MKLGVYIGSFNPPHKGHKKVINYLIDNNYVDNILIVPTMNYWHKQNLIDLSDRINMLKYFENDHVTIDRENNQYIYTVELLEVLKNKYLNDELYLIIGADNLLSLDKWKNYQKLLEYPIIVMQRGNIDIKSVINKYANHHFILIENFTFIDISSSKIRKELLNDYLDDQILDYIKNHNLYKE